MDREAARLSAGDRAWDVEQGPLSGGDREVGVRFRKPILLPGKVEFASASEGDAIQFAVRDAKRGTPHLDGRMVPTETKPKNGRK